MTAGYTPAVLGSTCMKCGTFVPQGTFHTCPTPNTWTTSYPVQFFPTDRTQELLDELKAIRKLLEKLADAIPNASE